MLFDLAADPHETVNRCGEEPARCHALEAELAAQDHENHRLAAALGFQPAPAAQIDESTRGRLQSLGYENP
jgi:hypothetical protein